MASLQSIIYQMVLSMLREAQFTSANPTHINKFKGLTSGPASDIGTDEEFAQAFAEIVRKELADLGLEESEEDLSQDLLDFEQKKTGGISESQKVGLASKGLSTAQNPVNIVSQGLAFLPHAVLISFAISLAPFIFQQLTRPGGPLDLRWKRMIDEEVNAFLSRQTQKDTELGFRQVIIQSKIGFTASNGVNNYNSIRGLREGGIDKERLDRIGMIDHSKGLFDFG